MDTSQGEKFSDGNKPVLQEGPSHEQKLSTEMNPHFESRAEQEEKPLHQEKQPQEDKLVFEEGTSQEGNGSLEAKPHFEERSQYIERPPHLNKEKLCIEEKENPCDISIAQTELSEIERTKYQKADWAEALKFAKKNSILDKSSGEAKPYPLNCNLEVLKKYSIGIFFYFDMLKKVSIFFFIASIICIPTFVSNYTGHGLTNPTGLFMLGRLSLANQPQVQVTIPNSTATASEKQQVQLQNDQNVKDFVNEMASRKFYVWLPDFFYSLIFFAFILYYKRFTNQQINLQKKQILPSQYCIEIFGIPRNTFEANEVKTFIQDVLKKYASVTEPLVVMEVAFSKDFKETLFLHRQESTLIENIQIEKKKEELCPSKSFNFKLLTMQKQLADIQGKIGSIVTKKLGGNAEYKHYETLSAFVVFNTFELKKQYCDIYHRYNNPHWIYKYILCCLRPRIPADLKFRGMYPIKIKTIVDEPSNIKWENLDVKQSNRYIRGFIVFLVVLVVMLLTLAVLLTANVLQPESTAQCPSNKYTFQQAQQINTSQSQYCYCTSIGLNEILSNSQIKGYCWETYKLYIETEALTIVSTLVIVLVNQILISVIHSLSNFLRFPNVTSEITTTAILLFICTFINTAILTLVLQSDIFGFVTAVYFTSPIPPLKNAQDSKSQTFSSDFDRDWFQNVGQKMLFTMLISTIFPQITQIITIPLQKCISQWLAKKKIIQMEMNKLMVGPDFNLINQYTRFMNIVFLCLFYSSGEPLLIPCACVSLTTQYWVFKYQLLRWNKRPPAFDDLLNRSMLQLIPWSLIFHLCVGVYMYGQPLIFPRSTSQLSTKISSTLNSAGVYDVVVTTSQNQPIVDRSYSSLALFILLALLVAFYIADIAIIKILKTIFAKVFFCFKRNTQTVKVIAIDSVDPFQFTYMNQYQQMGQLASYDIKMNEKYYSLITAIDVGSQSNTPRSEASPLGFGEMALKAELKKSKFNNILTQFNDNNSQEDINAADQRREMQNDDSPQPFIKPH